MIELPGLQVTNPQGYLAALGILRIATLHNVPARIGWIEGMCCFEGIKFEALIRLLEDYAANRATSAEYNLAKRMSQDAISLRRYLELLNDSSLRRWAEAMWYLGSPPSGPKKGTLSLLSTGLYLGGRQETWPTLKKAAQLITADKLQASLTAPWARLDNVSSLGWDPGGIKPKATLPGSKEPTQAAHQTEAASLWLAAEALPWLPARIQAMVMVENVWRYLVPTGLVDAGTACHLLKIGHWIGSGELAARGWEVYSAARVLQGKNAYALSYGARTTSEGQKPRGSRRTGSRTDTQAVTPIDL